MNNLVSRILLSIFLFPLGCLFYATMFLFSVLMLDLDEYVAIFVAGGATMAFAIFYWVLLWRQAVEWTQWRVIGTALAVLGSVGIAALLALLFMLYDDWEPGAVLGTFLAPITWLVATVMIWRETPGERAKRANAFGNRVIFCPRCSYNLTGLHEARCPECGSAYTLDELLAAQQGEQLRDIPAAGRAHPSACAREAEQASEPRP